MTKAKFKRGDKVLFGDMATQYTVDKVLKTTRTDLGWEIFATPKKVPCIEYTIVSEDEIKRAYEEDIVEYHPAVQELAKKVKSLREDIKEVIKL
jgi:hypothetical protein